MTTTERNLPSPFYAVVGAGDLALKQVSDAVTQIKERTEAAGETAQTRFEETRGRLNALPEELPGTIESTIESKMALTTSSARPLVRPDSWATRSMSSDFVTGRANARKKKRGISRV